MVLAAQGLPAAQGLSFAAQGLAAAQGLSFAAQGLAAAQGLSLAAQGLPAAQGLTSSVLVPAQGFALEQPVVTLPTPAANTENAAMVAKDLMRMLLCLTMNRYR